MVIELILVVDVVGGWMLLLLIIDVMMVEDVWCVVGVLIVVCDVE